MARNRAINGAASPAATASGDAARQREQESLVTNDMELGSAQSRTFEPSLETIPGISKRRTTIAVDPAGPSWPDYGSHIPVGPKASGEESFRYPWTDC